MMMMMMMMIILNTTCFASFALLFSCLLDNLHSNVKI